MRPRLRERAPTLSAALTSERGVLGLVTANDLVWQTFASLDPTTLGAAVERASESLLLPVLLSVAASVTPALGSTATAAQWLFVATVYYVYAPRIFRDRARGVVTDPRFRWSTVAVTLGWAVLTASFLLDSPFALDRPAYARGFLALAALSVGAYGWLFWRVFDVPGRAPRTQLDVLERFVPLTAHDRADLLARYEADPPWPAFQTALTLLALCAIPLVTTFLFGWLSVLVLGLSPLVEVLVGLGLGVDAAARRERLPTAPLGRAALDVETRFYDAVAVAGHGMKGWLSLLLVVGFGLFVHVLAFASLVAFLWTETLPFVLATLRTGVVDRIAFVITWNAAGMTVTTLAASVYGIWYWLRCLDRLPAYLSGWTARHGLAAADATDAAEGDVTRPVGLVVPPTLAVSVTLGWLLAGRSEAATLPLLTTADRLYAVAWPLTLVVLLGSVWLTRHAAPQPPRSDGVALPAAALIQFCGGYTAVGWLGADGGGLSPTFDPLTAFVLLAVPWFFYFADAYHWAEGRDDRWRYAFPGYVAAFGAGCLVIAALSAAPERSLFGIVGGFTGLLAVVLAAEDRLAPI
jgi:hypothetical protein